MADDPIKLARSLLAGGGYVPEAALPIRRLVKAPAPPPPPQSGLSQVMGFADLLGKGAKMASQVTGTQPAQPDTTTVAARDSSMPQDGYNQPVDAQPAMNRDRQDAVPESDAVPKGVDPRLYSIMQRAIKDTGFNVGLQSGYRPGDPRFHGKGLATDWYITDKDGNRLANYQSPDTFAQYQQLADAARAAQMEMYPDLADQFRWGGYFSGQKGHYGAFDLMHFDLGGSDHLGMAGGDWDTGLTPEQARIWGLKPGKLYQAAGYADGGSVLPEDERQQNLMDWHKDADPAFKNKDGSPKRLFHRTSASFDKFNVDPVTYLGEDPSNLPQMHNRKAEGDNIMPVHARASNPLLLDEFNHQEMRDRYAKGDREFPFAVTPETKKRLMDAGFDAIVNDDIYGTGDPAEYVMFDGDQIKSASGNRGTYDPNEDDITKSRGGALDKEHVREARERAGTPPSFPSAYMPGVPRQVHAYGGRAEENDNTWWHGSPSGDLRGGTSGLHLGTKEAALDALRARIGVPADGSMWDGTRKYGETKLAGKNTLNSMGKYLITGHNVDAPDEDYYAHEHPRGMPTVGAGVKVDPDWKPSLKPYKIVGEMSNSPRSPHSDSRANSMMKASLTKGSARRGYYYRNEGEDSGSISAVVPNGDHVREVDAYAAGGKVAYMEGNDVQIPETLYHGSGQDLEENQFDPHKVGPDQMGFHVGTKEQANEFARGPRGAHVMPLHVSMKNPITLRDEGSWTHYKLLDQLVKMGKIDNKEAGEVLDRINRVEEEDEDDPAAGSKAMAQYLQERHGHDGVRYLNRYEGMTEDDKQKADRLMQGNLARWKNLTDAEFNQLFPSAQYSYIAFKPTQLKSATGNNGDFDPENPDITKAEGGEVVGFGKQALHLTKLRNAGIDSKDAFWQRWRDTLAFKGGPNPSLSMAGSTDPVSRQADDLVRVHRADAEENGLQSVMSRYGGRPKVLSDMFEKAGVPADDPDHVAALYEALPDAKKAGGGEVSARKLNRLGLYSKAAEVLRGIKQPKATVGEYTRALDGKGVKAAEIEALGLDPSLKIARDEFADKFDRLTGRTIIKRRGANSPYEDDDPNAEINPSAKWRQYVHAPLRNYREHLIQHFPDYAEEGLKETLPNAPIDEMSDNRLSGNIEKHLKDEDRFTHDLHWKEPNVTAHVRMGDMREPTDDDVENLASRGREFDWNDMPDEQRDAHKMSAREVLRNRDHGINTLGVDEIQSDWGQQARAEGIRKTSDPEEIKRLEQEAKEAQREYENAAENHEQARDAFMEALNEHDPERRIDYHERFTHPVIGPFVQRARQAADIREAAFHRINDIHNQLYDASGEKGVPNAPYIANTQHWTDLALKHILTEAVKGGYDQISLPAGEMHADRWGAPEGSTEPDAIKRRNGLMKYYNGLVPQRMQALVKQHDPDAQVSKQPFDGQYHHFVVPITDKMRDSVGQGMPSFKQGGRIGMAGGGRKLNKLGLYSRAAEIARSLPQERGSVDQMLGMLPKRGASSIEMDRAGRPAGDKIDRETLAQHFESKVPELGVKTLGGDRLMDRMNGQTKYESYMLPGGENYREHLITLPPSAKWGVADRNTGNFVNDHRFDDYEGARQHALSLPDENTAILQENGTQYNSSHWDDPNVVAHVLTKDRRGPNGEKILHVEEIQSDWGQEARKKGVQQPVSTEGWIARRGEGDPASGPIWEVRNPAGRWVLGVPVDAAPDEQAAIQRAINNAPADRSPKTGVPDAPYIGNTDQWTQLAMKHALGEAARGGYDKVAFNVGNTLTDRYKLRNHVDALAYDPDEQRFHYQDKYHRWTEHPEPVSPEKLPEIIGQEAAQRLLATEPHPLSGLHLLEGDDLDFGGEGMLHYYDKVVPKNIQKLTGQQPKPIDVEGTPMRSIDMTDELRDNVLKGQPAFKRGGVVEAALTRIKGK